jgi:hypothetical protein
MNRSLARVGGTCSILLGASYLVVGVAYALTPAEQIGQGTEKFVRSYAANPVPFTIMLWAFATGALVALGAVPAISALVGDREEGSEGWMRWARNLAYVGFAVTAVDHFWGLAVAPARVDAYLTGDAATRAAIVATESLVSIDWQGWFRFGCTGFWALVVGVLALRGGALPKWLACLGIFGAAMYWVTLAGEALRVPVLVLLGAALGGCVVGPVWYIALGVILRRKGA